LTILLCYSIETFIIFKENLFLKTASHHFTNRCGNQKAPQTQKIYHLQGHKQGGCQNEGYNPKSHKVAPPTPTHNEMRMLLEWDFDPDGCGVLSFINVGG
jgi:hypothetical protein